MMRALIAVLALFVPTAQLFAQQTDVRTVPKVDVDRYMGVWHEVAAIPQFFQKQCVRDTTATYVKADDGQVAVTNACTTETNEPSKAQGRARVVDAATNAKLEVTFLSVFGKWLFFIGGDYWVIGLDEDYRWAIVGHPSRKYAWVLSRTPALPDADWARVTDVLKRNSYDLCTLMVSPQSDGLKDKKPLCEK
jgi:apolipoprotein D and lipocalin family protein